MATIKCSSDWVRSQYDADRFLPSKRARVETVLQGIAADIRDAQIQVCNIEDRVFEGRKLKSWQRIGSLSDRSAAFTCKGNRVPVVGYRPQLVRSGNGLVAHLAVPEGNAADSTQLVAGIDAAIRRTGCAPTEVSVDDGYASEAGIEALRTLGIETVSVSGSKGKKLTPNRGLGESRVSTGPQGPLRSRVVDVHAEVHGRIRPRASPRNQGGPMRTPREGDRL